MSCRKFPAPWRVDTTAAGHFVIKDATGFAVGLRICPERSGAAGQIHDTGRSAGDCGDDNEAAESDRYEEHSSDRK
jgi:hypothetical protein